MMAKEEVPANGTEPEFVSRQVLEARRYYLDLNPSLARGVRVVCGGCEHCQPDYRVGREGFPFLGVEFVARGEGSLALNGRHYPLKPGMAFAYGPGIPHEIHNAFKSPMVKYFVDFVGARALRLLGKGPLAGFSAATVSDAPQVMELFELLHRNGSGSAPNRHEICALLAELLLLKINEFPLADARQDTQAFLTYERARRHIEKNYLHIQCLDDLARAVHVDPAYLCRLFKRFNSLSPLRYCMQIKMNHAAELLLASGALVKNVSVELNFSDPYHFSRAFKSIYGIPPENYMRKRRQKLPG
jgi:AraC-like DNA-binding protein